jgi:hypothetical protein
MVKNKMVKNLPPSPNTRSSKMRRIGQRQLELQSLGTVINNMSAASNTQKYKGYCNSRRNETLNVGYLSGDFSLTDLTGTVFNYGNVDANFNGSDLTNAKFFGNGCLKIAGANLTGTSITGNSANFYCNYFPLNSYISFTKDRTTTCITPLGENENISLNNFLNYDNDNDRFFDLNLFNSVINPRYLFTNSKGKITITKGEVIQILNTLTSLNTSSYSIKLDTNNEKLIVENVPQDTRFKFKITIKQEATDQYKEGSANVILEYNLFNSFCNNSLIDKLTFVKDRFNTKCLTPLEANETIVINAFISYEDPDFYYYGRKGYFNPLDLSKAIFSGRYLFKKSKGNITITDGEFLEITSDEYKNYIKLDMVNKKLIFEKGFNSSSIIAFKFKITIKQEETGQIASVILEYSLSGPYPLPVCSVNDILPTCIGGV